jgi:2-hydroxychromene-2-carboxylate isomerase
VSTAILEHMVSTVALLRAAYPDGIPKSEQAVLMAVMSDTGMSSRSVATALGYYFNQPYENFLHQTATCALDASVTEEAKERVRDHLRSFGFDRWAEED